MRSISRNEQLGCDRCEHIFVTGEVVYWKWRPTLSAFGPGRYLSTYCETCVRGWHEGLR